MPFFLFADAILIGGIILWWLHGSGFAADPLNEAMLLALFGAHGMLVLSALYKRNRIGISWFGVRQFAQSAGLTLVACFLALAPEATGALLVGDVPSRPTLEWFRSQLPLMACFALAGIGSAAMCFALLCLELERSGARQMAVYLGASGYALLFSGYVGSLPCVADGGLAGGGGVALAAMSERWMMAYAAGYLFIATRHLMAPGLLLGLWEWSTRSVLSHPGAMIGQEPLWNTGALPLEAFWGLRLVGAGLALGWCMWMYGRCQPPDDPRTRRHLR